jgi:hypothetical protein
MLLSATEVTILSNISASAATIAASGYLEEIQETIFLICNSTFETDLFVQGGMTFYPSTYTIIGTTSFEALNFASGDDIYIYNSYRNDGIKTIASIPSTSTLTLLSSCTIYEELSNRSIMISVVKWPITVKRIAAQMIAYDYDVRPKKSLGVKSFTLGPFSESYTIGDEDEYGYPKALTDRLIPYRRVRLM